jgi:hypothetical protein
MFLVFNWSPYNEAADKVAQVTTPGDRESSVAFFDVRLGVKRSRTGSIERNPSCFLFFAHEGHCSMRLG